MEVAAAAAAVASAHGVVAAVRLPAVVHLQLAVAARGLHLQRPLVVKPRAHHHHCSALRRRQDHRHTTATTTGV